MSNNQEHLKWIYDRLILVHNENPNVDYMVRFRKIIDDTGAVSEPSEVMELFKTLLSEVDEDEIHDHAHWLTHDNTRCIADLLQHQHPQPVAIPGEAYHEDMGPCLWWQFPIEEPPYSGMPIDDDWPGYHTHFTPLVIPAEPAHPEATND